MIQYTISNLQADESHVATMLNQITATVNRTNLKDMARSNSQQLWMMQPQSSSKAIKVEVARNGTGLKSRLPDDSEPSSAEEPSPKSSINRNAALVKK